jgi:HEAT repeat protein/beta-lactamase regulating signal transducer with metallopeptidase domain
MPLHFAQFSEYAGTWISVLLNFSIKGAIILAVAGLLVVMMSRASAAARHLVWNMSLAALLVLPLLSFIMPEWRVAVLPEIASAAKVEQTDTEMAPVIASSTLIPEAEKNNSEKPNSFAARADEKVTAPVLSAETSQTPIKESAPASDSENVIARTESSTLGWAFWALAIWLAGAMVVALRMLVGTVSVWWIVQRARPVEDDSWNALMEFLVWQLELKRPVRLLESRSVSMPITCGMFRSVVLIPQGADEWAEERRQVVLSHELAHVKRRDCLTQMLAQLACALYWFNPLIWIAARRLRVERELACDDYVLSTGTRASDYAGHLLDLARTMRSAHLSSLTAVAIARRSQLEGRLLAILDPGLKRRGLNRTSAAVVAILLACIVLPLAALRPATRAEASFEVSQKSKSSADADKSPAKSADSTSNKSAANSADADKKKSAEPDDEDQDDDSDVEPEPDNPENPDQEKNDGMDQAVNGSIADSVASAVATIQSGQDSKDSVRQGVIEGLKAALKDEDPQVRKEAMRALGMAGGSEVVPMMLEALKDRDPGTRKQAAWVLGMKGNSEVVEPLINALRDENAQVREQAAWALGLKGDQRALEPLASALNDSSAQVREQSVWALGLKGNSSSIDPLMGALKDQNSQVRERAAWALGLKGDSRAVDALITALSDSDRQVREQAAWALGLKGDNRAVDPLINALKDESADVREQAAWALGLKGDSRAMNALNAALKDTNKGVREQAAWALGMLLMRNGGRSR